MISMHTVPSPQRKTKLWLQMDHPIHPGAQLFNIILHFYSTMHAIPHRTSPTSIYYKQLQRLYYVDVTDLFSYERYCAGSIIITRKVLLRIAAS